MAALAGEGQRSQRVDVSANGGFVLSHGSKALVDPLRYRADVGTAHLGHTIRKRTRHPSGITAARVSGR
ncbi:hypothetical protein BN10_1260003 [Phycicoccus elongatus Lp2]|uniref:Uncharacterized protein n=1 Tax=Phycicoccus elongatus Lp2 TaxID=1193181 RepID=N0E200_9MICO|nr:hypothetical protein BN10_1260003 [Phycicoccus elongatus Lp2]